MGATGRQGICDLLLAFRYHIMVSFCLNRFNANNQNSEEDTIFPHSQEKSGKSATKTWREVEGVENIYIPSIPLLFSWGSLRAWQSRNATALAHCSTGAQGAADYTLAAVEQAEHTAFHTFEIN